MANGLLGTYIATFSTTNIVSNSSLTFVHSLGAAPDIVIVQKLVNTTIATEVSAAPNYSADATNVTLSAPGLACGVCRCTAIVAHSIIS